MRVTISLIAYLVWNITKISISHFDMDSYENAVLHSYIERIYPNGIAWLSVYTQLLSIIAMTNGVCLQL